MPAKVDKMVSAIKDQLRKQHPNWSEDKIEQTAWAIANSKMKEKTSEEIIVGENVKINITCEAVIGEEIKE